MRDASPSRVLIARLRIQRESDLTNPIITLTTDYGTNDHLVGVLKGVILRINPDVQIVDITHGVTPFDLLDGATVIANAYSYFPPRTIHVVVVDPGVGTERRPLIVSGQNQYFLAPDNGVLSGVYEKEQNFMVRHLTPSITFCIRSAIHFTAGRLRAGGGLAFKELAAGQHGRGDYGFQAICAAAAKEADGLLKGVVLKVDSFGNLITNFRGEDLPDGAMKRARLIYRLAAMPSASWCRHLRTGLRAKRSSLWDQAAIWKLA